MRAIAASWDTFVPRHSYTEKFFQDLEIFLVFVTETLTATVADVMLISQDLLTHWMSMRDVARTMSKRKRVDDNNEDDEGDDEGIGPGASEGDA